MGGEARVEVDGQWAITNDVLKPIPKELCAKANGW
jgi:hypothetical protein